MLKLVRCAVTLSVAVGFATACGAPSGHSAAARCDQELRKDRYVANFEKPGEAGRYRLRLVSSTPGPPEKGINQWIVEVLDGGGAPIAGAQLSATSAMPDHGHAPVTRTAVEQSPGRYALAPDLFMSGLWVVTLTAKVGADSDRVDLKFCIEG